MVATDKAEALQGAQKLKEFVNGIIDGLTHAALGASATEPVEEVRPLQVKLHSFERDGEFRIGFHFSLEDAESLVSGDSSVMDLSCPQTRADIRELLDKVKSDAQAAGYARLAETIVGPDLPENVSPASRVPQIHNALLHAEVLAWNDGDTFDDATAGTLFFIERPNDTDRVYAVLPEGSEELLKFDHARLIEE